VKYITNETNMSKTSKLGAYLIVTIVGVGIHLFLITSKWGPNWDHHLTDNIVRLIIILFTLNVLVWAAIAKVDSDEEQKLEELDLKRREVEALEKISSAKGGNSQS